MTIKQMMLALEAGETTSVELLQAALAKEEEFKAKKSIGILSPLAMERARKMDAERKAGRVRGPPCAQHPFYEPVPLLEG